MAQAGDRLNRRTSRWSPRQVARQALVACLPVSRFVESFPGTDAVYLTFDDGPHPEFTPRVLDVLRDHGAWATFFVVGRECEKHPEIVRRIAAEGHAIGNHTYSHVSANDVSSAEWESELRRTNEALRNIVGNETRLVRPPFGKIGIAGLMGRWRNDQTVVLWNVDPKDFACRDSEQLWRWFEERPLAAGDVVLLHDVNPWTPDVLGRVIESTQRRPLRLDCIPGCNSR